ncbi:alpha/beta hydrolase [Streptomyces sp. S.PB5]|uniref:alpha/beta fold hydrolase n=1 Tax=Streptomyces sp. S.PB5 TaxID=3020844 RepID=UPI0025AF2EAA|nr:alpha/beta hydrolase [Streptomyces sp. S.PB5]MDN3022774.1 alpha/beta hydrolase [Streptomyces sp. S.PB5]
MPAHVAHDDETLEEVRTIPMWMPAPNGPLVGVQLRRRGLYGPHWEGIRAAFVPGACGAKEDFLPLMRRLVEADHRLFAVDQCGQHETPGVDDPAAYTLRSLAEDLAVAITASCARKPVHLVGHGAGALVAATAVAEVVGRTVASPSKYPTLTLVSPCWEGMAAVDGVGSEDWERCAAAQHRGGEVSPERGEEIRQRLARSHPQSLRGLTSAAAPQDLVARLRAAGLPMLVVQGAEDTVVSRALTEDVARQLGARHRVVEDAGHLPHQDNPGALAEILLGFWEECDERVPRARWEAV